MHFSFPCCFCNFGATFFFLTYYKTNIVTERESQLQYLNIPEDVKMAPRASSGESLEVSLTTRSQANGVMVTWMASLQHPSSKNILLDSQVHAGDMGPYRRSPAGLRPISAFSRTLSCLVPHCGSPLSASSLQSHLFRTLDSGNQQARLCCCPSGCWLNLQKRSAHNRAQVLPCPPLHANHTFANTSVSEHKPLFCPYWNQRERELSGHLKIRVSCLSFSPKL